MTIKVYTTDGKVEEYPNAYAYWEWDENEEGTDSAYRICSMDRMMNSAIAYVHPGECAKIEITSEESDRIFKSLPSEGMGIKQYKIFKTIAEERKRQDEKWGEQNHPMLDVPFTTEGMLQSQRTYKQLNDSMKDCCWFTILMEEIYESFSETDPAKQREEMVQVAAMAVQIIEYLDRKMEVEG